MTTILATVATLGSGAALGRHCSGTIDRDPDGYRRTGDCPEPHVSSPIPVGQGPSALVCVSTRSVVCRVGSDVPRGYRVGRGFECAAGAPGVNTLFHPLDYQLRRLLVSFRYLAFSEKFLQKLGGQPLSAPPTSGRTSSFRPTKMPTRVKVIQRIAAWASWERATSAGSAVGAMTPVLTARQPGPAAQLTGGTSLHANTP